MAVFLSKAPELAETVLATALMKLRGPVGGGTKELSRTEKSEVEAPAPLPVFIATAEDILNGGVVQNAELRGWSYTMFRGSTPIANAEVAENRPGEGMRFSHFNEGPFVRATIRAAAIAERFGAKEANDFELRLVRAPAIGLQATWLHAEDLDFFFPIGKSHRLLESNRVYSGAEFEKSVKVAVLENLRLAGKAEPAALQNDERAKLERPPTE